MKYGKTFGMLLALSSFIVASSTFTYAAPYSQSELYLDKNGACIKTLADHKIISDAKDGHYHPEMNATNQDVIDMFYAMTQNVDNYNFRHLEKKLANKPEKLKILGKMYKSQNVDYEEHKKLIEESFEAAKADDITSQDIKTSDEKNPKDVKEEKNKTENSDKQKVAKKEPKEDKVQKYQEISKKDINECFIKLGLVTPEDLDKFNPNEDISKEKFASYLFHFLNSYHMIDKDKKIEANDIQNSNYKTNIKVILGNKILFKDENENFNPQEKLTKSDLARFISYISNFKIENIPPVKIHYKVLNVPYVSQLYPVYAPIGCEPTSVYAALRYKGYAQNTTHRQFLNQMPYDSIDPRRGFVGSPFAGFQNYSKRETIFPNALAAYAKKYGNAVDISGASVEDIQKEIMFGNPVVAYLTFAWESPRYRNYYVEGKTYRWLRNNHVVVVCGYDPSTNRYYVSDPWNKNMGYGVYKYWVNGNTFKYIYDARRHAIAIR